MKPKLLLISYTFPPYPGIGGRRWAKFAKYLSELGHEIYVISATNNTGSTSLWFDDIANNPSIHIFPISSNYPLILDRSPDNVLKKIKYKFALLFMKLVSKGSPYDKALLWNEKALKLADSLISKHGIKHVIVSSAPFSTSYALLKLKALYPSLKYYVDFRDPWTWGSGYGMKSISASRLRNELDKEKSVIKDSDAIFVPVDVMYDHLITTYPLYKQKIKLLPHAFDEQEIVGQAKDERQKGSIVYYGSLYNGIGDYIESIARELENEDLRIDIYSDTTRYADLFERHKVLNKRVYYHKPLIGQDLFSRIKKASFVLFIHPDYGIDNLSTKFYEVIATRTPIIYVGKPGKVSQFIVSNKLGFFIQLSDMKEKIHICFQSNNEFDYNENFDVSVFSFAELSKELSNTYLNYDSEG